jgi:hypothetical protein
MASYLFKQIPIESFSVNNKNNFPDMLDELNLSIMKNDILELLLRRRGDENQYFDMDHFNRNYVNDFEKTTGMVNKIAKELEENGWKCLIAMGGSALYIYSTENKPELCW